MDRPPEVRNFDGAHAVQQVLRLDVPVDHVLVVQIPQSKRQLTNVVCRSSLSEALVWLLFELFVKFTTWRVLKNKINFLFVPEETVHAQDIFMPKMALNFDFSSELVLNVAFLQLLFVKHFERNNKLGFLFPGQVDVPEFSPPKRLPKLKVLNGPLFGFLILLLAV